MRSFNWENSPLDRNILLEASAGTGKTYTLERLVMRLVTEREIPLPRILVVTFTNMAAREMQERIGRLLSRERESAEGRKGELLRRAVRDFDRASVFTIHGFCTRVLQTLPFECGLAPGTEVGGEDELTGRLVQDWFRKNEERNDPFLLQGYRAAYDRNRGYAPLLKSIENHIASEKLNGSWSLIPGEDAKEFWKELCLKWEQSSLRNSACRLASSCRELGEPGQMSELLKRDGLGKRLGPKTEGLFYSQLADLDKGKDSYDFFTCLDGMNSTFFTQLSQAADEEFSGTSEFTKAYSAFALSLPGDVLEQKSVSSLLAGLALLFEFQCAGEIIAERNRERRGTGQLTFNDLIDMVHGLLAGPYRKPALIDALARRYQVLLVDEFQDTDFRQWEIFSLLFGGKGKNFFLIGDPKQSIYRFRGADLNVYLDVRDSLPEENCYRLDNNFRSHPLLLDGFNRLFAPLFGEEGRPGSIGYSPVGAGRDDIGLLLEGEVPVPPVDFLRLEGEPANREEAVELWLNAQADHILDLLSGLEYTLNGKRVRPSHIAVLLENNKQCVRFQELLSARAVPAVIFQERDVFDSREVSFPLMFLEAMIGRDRGESLKRLLLSPLVGLNPAEMLFLEDRGYLDSLILRFRLYREKTDRGDLIGQFYRFCRLGKDISRFLAEGGAIDSNRADYLGENFLIRLMRDKGGERLYTNLRHILEILHTEQLQKRLNTTELHRFCRSELYHSHGDETFQVRLDRDGEAVRIMTLHKSKGLQFPLVFFGGGLYSEVINRKSSFYTFHRGEANWCDYLKGQENGARARREEWEEKKRLYYVGLTRAESKLFLPLFENWDNNWLSWFYDQVSSAELAETDPFEKSILSLPGGTALKSCEALAAVNPALFRIVSPLPGEGRYASVERSDHLEKPVLPPLKLNERYPSLLSFSSLTDEGEKGGDAVHDEERAQEADYDEGRDDPEEGEKEVTPENIPGGTGLGNLVHSLFEEIDYRMADTGLSSFEESEEADAFIREKALFYFKSDWFRQFGSTVKQMVWNTLNSPLSMDGEGKDTLCLKDLPADKRLHELEFLIKMRSGGKVSLDSFFQTTSRGYLKGFIDLIFFHGGRYYIADWKTTRCAANDRNPYGEESVRAIMDDHRYHLQYWIYTAAFHLFMVRSGSDFDYDRDFGGIFYFFNRGMNPDYPGRGVFFTRPGKEDLMRFYENFTEETCREL